MIVRSGKNRLAVEGSPDFQRWAVRQFADLLQLVAQGEGRELRSRGATLEARAFHGECRAHSAAHRVLRLGYQRIRDEHTGETPGQA